MFVTVTYGRLSSFGIARLVSNHAGTATIEFFAGPDYDQQPQFEVPAALVRRAHIPRETRIFSPVEGGVYWRVGRCLDGTDDPIQIQYPNQEILNVPSTEVYVRWRKPIENPARYLSRMVTETPHFASRRIEFVASIAQQRASAYGLTAALASAIEMQPHQLDVARRVLHDPIQRYLLADEVGLGKTIEACLILRQFFIDRPTDATAVIAVPTPLVSQWTSELTKRFALGDRIGKNLIIADYDAACVAAKKIAQLGMFIIDEAHHVTGASARELSMFTAVSDVAKRTPRLLLLSATPALGNEAAFLKLLHLLDPETYPLDSISAFRRRVESRQQVAEIVSALTPDNALIIDSYLDDLLASFGDDETLRDEIASLRPVLQRLPDQDDEDLITRLSRLRTHVADTYRLDRRILRNRRAQLPLLTPRRRGSQAWSYRDAARIELARAADLLRRLLSTFDLEGDARAVLADAKRSFLDALAEGPRALQLWLAELDAMISKGAEDAVANLRTIVESIVASTARLEGLYRHLRTLLERDIKVVIFCCNEQSAEDVYTFLRARMPSSIERHGATMLRGRPGWTRFVPDKTCRVLVCDASAEEGLNLQGGAKAIVHYELPFNPNRVEQRLGRVDRFGAGNAIESYSVICDDDEFETEWYRCLSNGFGVFSESIASLQFLVDEDMVSISEAILGGGASVLDGIIERLGGDNGAIAAERKRIASQDVLDSISEDDSGRWDEMMDVDSDWKAIAKGFNGWVREGLIFGTDHVHFESRLPEGDRVSRYVFANDARRPTLVSATDFSKRFADAMDTRAPGFKASNPATYPYSFRRATALGLEGRNLGVRLLRLGDSFFNGLADFTDNDDRGRAYAMWRTAPNYEATSVTDVDVYFAVLVTVSCDISAVRDAVRDRLDDSEATAAVLDRQAGAAFSPRIFTAWLDGNLASAPREHVEKWLVFPYNQDDNSLGGSDTNIRTSRWDVLRSRGLPELAVWSTLPERAAVAAISSARSAPEIVAAISTAARDVVEKYERRKAAAATRMRRLDAEIAIAERRSADLDELVTNSLLHGIREPKFTIDSIGAIFLSASPFPLEPTD